MNFTSILYKIENRICTITLNHPERRNALDDIMIKELTEAFSHINRNNHTRAVLLTGSGNSFCAGMDLDYLKRFSELGHMENLEDAQNLMKLLYLINTLKKPVIAMVNGPAMGGGCGLAAACDFVFAGRKQAKLGVPEVRLGFIPAIILIFLIKRMGEGRAREFVLKGEVIDAQTAKERNLITDVFDDDKLSDMTYLFAEELISNTCGASVTLTKDLFSRLNEMNQKEILEYGANLNALVRKTEDFKKGINSFIKKEKLRW